MSALQMTAAPASMAAPAATFPLEPTRSAASNAMGPISVKDAFTDSLPRIGAESLPALRLALRRKNLAAFKAVVEEATPYAVVDPLAAWHDQRADGSLYAVAAAHHWAEAIEWLSEQGVDPNINTLASHPIVQALLAPFGPRAAHAETIEALLKAGSNPSSPALDNRFGGLPRENCTIEDMQGRLRREARLGWLDWHIINNKLQRGLADKWAIRSAAACFALDFPRGGDASLWTCLGARGWRPSEHDLLFMQMAYFQAKRNNQSDIQKALVGLGLLPDAAIAQERMSACLNGRNA
jgi:hypothetical protein